MITSTTCIGTHTCIRLYHELDIACANVRRMCSCAPHVRCVDGIRQHHTSACVRIAYTDTASQRGRASTKSARTASQRSAATNKSPFSSSPFCRPLPHPCPPALTPTRQPFTQVPECTLPEAAGECFDQDDLQYAGMLQIGGYSLKYKAKAYHMDALLSLT
jgi:hypothetical protein